MLKYLELIPVEPVQAGNGAEPHKTVCILKDTVDAVVGKAIANIQVRELVYIFLRIQAGVREQTQKDSCNGPGTHRLIIGRRTQEWDTTRTKIRINVY